MSPLRERRLAYAPQLSKFRTAKRFVLFAPIYVGCGVLISTVDPGRLLLSWMLKAPEGPHMQIEQAEDNSPEQTKPRYEWDPYTDPWPDVGEPVQARRIDGDVNTLQPTGIEP